MKFDPAKEYKNLLNQAYSMQALINSMESQIRDLSIELDVIKRRDRSISENEIDALREENQMLTNLLEEKERKS